MKLSEEQVKHIAKLAKIKLKDNEIAMYQVTLGKLMAEIDQVEDIVGEGDILISPTNNDNQWFTEATFQPNEALLENAPHTKGNYIEVERVLND